VILLPEKTKFKDEIILMEGVKSDRVFPVDEGAFPFIHRKKKGFAKPCGFTKNNK